MNAVRAHALRRGAVAATVVFATLLAHLASGVEMALTPLAPATWVTFVLVAALSRMPHEPMRFQAWGVGKVAGIIAVGQALGHMVMHSVPWMFGFVGHAHHAMITPEAIVTHLVATVVLTGLLCWGQRLLSATVALVRALVAPRVGQPRPCGRQIVPEWRLPDQRTAQPRRSRGPPMEISCA